MCPSNQASSPMPLNWVMFFSPGFSRRTTFVLFHVRSASSGDFRRFSVNETLALLALLFGDASSYMHTIEPWPGASFMGTPIIAWASAAVNLEQGSTTAAGDSG